MLSALPLCCRMKKTMGPHCPWIIALIWCRVGGRRLSEDKQFRDVHMAQEKEGRRALSKSFQRNCVPSFLNSLYAVPTTHTQGSAGAHLSPSPNPTSQLSVNGPILIPDKVYHSDHLEEREANSSLPRIASLKHPFLLEGCLLWLVHTLCAEQGPKQQTTGLSLGRSTLLVLRRCTRDCSNETLYPNALNSTQLFSNHFRGWKFKITTVAREGWSSWLADCCFLAMHSHGIALVCVGGKRQVGGIWLWCLSMFLERYYSLDYF